MSAAFTSADGLWRVLRLLYIHVLPTSTPKLLSFSSNRPIRIPAVGVQIIDSAAVMGLAVIGCLLVGVSGAGNVLLYPLTGSFLKADTHKMTIVHHQAYCHSLRL